jgi:hypothetical protein
MLACRVSKMSFWMNTNPCVLTVTAVFDLFVDTFFLVNLCPPVNLELRNIQIIEISDIQNINASPIFLDLMWTYLAASFLSSFRFLSNSTLDFMRTEAFTATI